MQTHRADHRTVRHFWLIKCQCVRLCSALRIKHSGKDRVDMFSVITKVEFLFDLLG